MPKPLVIVESPAKAKTIAGFLGRDFVVESSIGHIRDLPAGTKEVPEQYRQGEMARLAGVDPDNDFKTVYISRGRAKEQVKKLKALLKDASELYLATDEDREGESIAWHLQEVLSPRVPVRRMVFHEITRSAIERAVEESRDINVPLVDAQETRRILDRLYGWELSPVLWRKVMTGLSAGRVQSVATRIVVERERERLAFRAASYWDLVAALATDPSFTADLVNVGDRRVATGKDFDQQGSVRSDQVLVLDEQAATQLASGLAGATFTVRSVEEKPYRSRPAAPFMTSTLQQEASRKLGFGAQRTMRAAQSLYENGYITYMRTDSTTLSEEALSTARSVVRELYGADYVPDAPRTYAKKVKNAQEAHEAIRPAGERWRAPDAVRREVGSDEARVYELVWQRTLASQMVDAVGRTVSLRLLATATSGEACTFAASGTTITFPGFQRVYVESADDDGADDGTREARLPALAVGDEVAASSVDAVGHSTNPPSRYTEASLVKRLEELGVGRPSTYASILATIQDRGYVWKKGSALVPSFLGFAVVGLLEQHFPMLIDYGFTAALEDDLDAISRREAERVPWLRAFYFGNGRPGLKTLVSKSLDEIDAREVNSIDIGIPGVVVRVGRYGPYLERGDQRASIPEELAPDELTAEKVEELLSAPSDEGRELGTDPETGLVVSARSGRFGPYVQLGEQEEGSKAKPKRSSLFKTMSPATVTLDEALALLSLPRVVGVDPATGEEITAQNGRYGPYLKKGSDSRSLQSEEQLLTVTLDEALAVYSQPKQYGRGRAAAAPPLRELGPDPVSGQPMVVKDGRFGPYVTDGETNASLRKGDEVETLTVERAAELLSDRRAAGPPKKRKKAVKATKAAKPAKTTTRVVKAGAAKKAAGAKKATKATKAAKKSAD